MQYIVRENSNQWKFIQSYIPHVECSKCKMYEVVFARLNGRKDIEVSLEIPKQFQQEEVELFFANGRGGLHEVGFERLEDSLLFSTSKVGVYIVVAKTNKASLFTKIANNASIVSKTMGYQIDKVMKGM